MLWGWVNALTAVLTFCSLIGYAVVYTVWLKHATPQNIVIGGAAGAAPPVLGWTAVTGQVDPHALLLFLIIFTWTPPHFWALAIARRDEYAKAGIPMLPVAYSSEFTRLHILLYTILLVIVTLLPYLTGMSGLIYLAAALVLGGFFLFRALQLKVAPDVRLPMRTFSFSITYLALLFAALLVDHYFTIRYRVSALVARACTVARVIPWLLLRRPRADRLRLAVSVQFQAGRDRRRRARRRSVSCRGRAPGAAIASRTCCCICRSGSACFCGSRLRWRRVAVDRGSRRRSARCCRSRSRSRRSTSRARVPSLTDLTLNALGTLLGATGGLAWGGLTRLMHLPARARTAAARSGCGAAASACGSRGVSRRSSRSSTWGS